MNSQVHCCRMTSFLVAASIDSTSICTSIRLECSSVHTNLASTSRAPFAVPRFLTFFKQIANSSGDSASTRTHRFVLAFLKWRAKESVSESALCSQRVYKTYHLKHSRHCVRTSCLERFEVQSVSLARQLMHMLCPPLISSPHKQHLIVAAV